MYLYMSGRELLWICPSKQHYKTAFYSQAISVMYIHIHIDCRFHVYTCAGEAYDPPAARELSTGDGVRVELDPGLFKAAQEDHGGWDDSMAEVYTCTCMCTCVCVQLNRQAYSHF